MDGTDQGVWQNPHHEECWKQAMRDRWRQTNIEPERRRLEQLMGVDNTEEKTDD